MLAEGTREDFGIVLGAALTLLGLIIGFSFSLAVSRYDQRKNYEEAEANAIGTECNLLVGYGAHNAKVEGVPLLALPLLVAISFYLIADIDSPRGGLIRVAPQNLVSLVNALGK